MAEPVTLQTLLTYLTLISVPVGVFYHIMTLRNTRRNQELQLETRQTQLFMQIYGRLTDSYLYEEYMKIRDQEWDDLEDYIEKYGVGPNVFDIYLEGVGVLVKRKQIDIRLVDDIMSSIVLGYWESHGSMILEMRENRGLPQIGEWTEYLVNEIQKVSSKEHPELNL